MKQINPKNKDRFSEFMAGKGFYIALFLCVVAIGISGYFLIRTSYEPVPAPGPTAVAGPAEIVVPDEPVLAPEEVVIPDATVLEDEPFEDAEPARTPAESEPVAIVWPIPGEVINDYSADVPVFSATLGDWRTHEGFDIAAAIGAKVMAVSAGKVSTVFNDDLMGTTVVITHANGLCSVYSNLADTPAVKEGDEVGTGDIIGAVGATAIAEISEPSHLHFEMLQDGLSVNPAEYLPAR